MTDRTADREEGYFREERPDFRVIGAGLLMQTFRRDLGRFASRAKQPYLEKVFTSVPALVGKRIKYVNIDPDARSRELKATIELLATAGRIQRIHRSAAPLSAYPPAAGSRA